MTLALEQSACKLDLITSFISGQLQWTLACEQHTHFVTMTIKDGNYMACEPKTLDWDTLSLRPHRCSGLTPFSPFKHSDYQPSWLFKKFFLYSAISCCRVRPWISEKLYLFEETYIPYSQIKQFEYNIRQVHLISQICGPPQYLHVHTSLLF